VAALTADIDLNGRPYVTAEESPANSFVVFVATPEGWRIDEIDPGTQG
jgi:hypothetical protein